MRAPFEFGDGSLKPFTNSIWIATTPIRFFGTWFPHVMTVVRLNDGTLLLHSPCRSSPELVEAIAAIGNVAHIVAPNWFHDLYLDEYRAIYPNATLWGPAFLKKQRPSLVDTVLDIDPTPWEAEMPHVSLRGLLTFDESIFYHRASETAIVADFLMNAVANERTPLLTRIGYAFFGLRGQLKVFPILHWFGIAHRASMRQVANALIAWHPQRLIVGHGTPLAHDAFDELEQALNARS